MIEQMMLRDDVENSGAGHAAGVIEAHAMQHARAAIVACSVETREAEGGHHLDLILRHGAERVGAVVLAARRLLRIAIAAQVSSDHGELPRQLWRKLVPRQV